MSCEDKLKRRGLITLYRSRQDLILALKIIIGKEAGGIYIYVYNGRQWERFFE